MDEIERELKRLMLRVSKDAPELLPKQEPLEPKEAEKVAELIRLKHEDERRRRRYIYYAGSGFSGGGGDGFPFEFPFVLS